MARADAPPAGQMVLCTGAGLVSVHVDAEGNPTGAPHLCPDAVPGFLVALPLAEPLPLPADFPHRAGWRENGHVAPAAPPAPRARAPRRARSETVRPFKTIRPI